MRKITAQRLAELSNSSSYTGDEYITRYGLVMDEDLVSGDGLRRDELLSGTRKRCRAIAANSLLDL